MQTQPTMIEWLGKNAGYISAIIGCLSLVLWKPLSLVRKRKKARILAEKSAEAEFKETVLHELSTIKKMFRVTNDEVAQLQCDRLFQAHDYYMDKGYCSTERKQFLCEMFQAYHDKGLNHLSAYYQEDLLKLPDKPPKSSA